MTALMITIAAVLVLLLCALVILFNRLIRLRNRCDNAWHQIDVQLKRRYDLVPELAEVVKGYASHEREALESVARARTRAVEAAGVSAQGPAEDRLTGAIAGVYAVAERYPDLKANKDFLKFQRELSSTETDIAGARKYYNGAVMYYDNARMSFPGNIVARLFRGTFTGREYFEISVPADREAPSASLEPDVS
jgi:LemA protein